jgi:cellulose synthase/poly-beta-1,6-N-acetylglucosamine synthase-like glycosyltransferase
MLNQTGEADRQPDAGPRCDPAGVTVIVPTRNEEANIVRFLESLPSATPLVVVDCSEDRTPSLIAAHRPHRTTVIRAQANIPEARQIGAEAATTPWLLFTDADVTFRADYFQRLGEVAVPPEVGGMVGTKSTAGGFDTYHRWFARGQRVLHWLGIPAASGSNMLLRRSALNRVGGFDLQLTVNEDTEVMFRVAKGGYVVSYRPELVVQSFDHRRLEAGLARKVVHGAIRNSALWLGVFGKRVRSGDWGYWDSPSPQPTDPTGSFR